MQRLTLFTSIGADRATRNDDVSSERVSERASDAAMERVAAKVRRNTSRPAARRIDDTNTQDIDDAERESRPVVSKSEFSALLAMIAGAGEQVRANLVRQLPPETASLVDRLLEGATPDAIGDVLSNESADASEALRNGLRTLSSARTDAVADATGDTSSNGPAPIATAANAAAARAAEKQRNLEILSRIMSPRGGSMEQLLAVGDTEGAKMRATIEALLSKAGTPEGARLAARTALSQVNGAMLSGDSMDADALKDGIMNSRDVSMATKDVNALDPELQARLAKVQERMAELGHDVQIVETTRSQDRQDWLFAQGRTRGGPVVTWTRDSAHTRGDAVDVMIDGSYNNKDAFALLQRVAREEGLRTLGDRDPGHLELKGEGAASGIMAADQADGTTAARAMTSNAGMASVARVAGVAGVANVAAPGRGVRVVRSESIESPEGNGTSAVNTRGNTSLGAIAMNARRDAQQQSMSQDGAMQGDARRDRSRDGVRVEGDAPAFGALHGNATFSHSTTSTNAPTAAPQAGVAQAERVADIQQMRADAPVAPISRMTLDVDGANGAERITIGVRGNSVQAHIATDADTAGHLRLHTAELQDALGRHGLDGDTVRISAAGRAEQTDATRGTGERELAARLVTTSANAQEGAGNENSQGQQGRAPTREWDRQDARRDQARARDEQQDARQRQSNREDAQERQRRANTFFGQV